MSQISYRSPLYIQLREVIRSKIEEGEYPPGTAIPSENQLAETYGLNQIGRLFRERECSSMDQRPNATLNLWADIATP